MITKEELAQVLDGIHAHMEKRDARITLRLDSIAAEVAELKKQTVTADKAALLEVKIAHLERACDANRRHTQNLDTRLQKATSNGKGYTIG